MGNRLKLPDVDFTKVGNTLVNTGKTVGKFVSDHTPEFLVGALSLVTVDNIRVRLGRKQDQKAFEKNAINQQAVIRKHEAEINVLKEQADQAQDAQQRVDRLEQIVKNITEGGASE